MPRPRHLKALLFALGLVLMASLASAADSTRTVMPLLSGRPQKSTTAAVFMSMAVPGLGQAYTHNYIKAAAAVAIEGALGWAISFNNDQYHGYRRANQVAQQNLAAAYAENRPDTLVYRNLIDTFYGPRERFFKNQRNRNIWWLAGTVILSMGDAYVDAHMYGLDFSPDITFKGGTVGLSVACKF
ncbi:MAG TPA: DUF5683 domain-containing protein [bacterium]|jgi:hypothetical protein